MGHLLQRGMTLRNQSFAVRLLDNIFVVLTSSAIQLLDVSSLVL